VKTYHWIKNHVSHIGESTNEWVGLCGFPMGASVAQISTWGPNKSDKICRSCLSTLAIREKDALIELVRKRQS